jgi:DNA-binding transcriptional MerR regulator
MKIGDLASAAGVTTSAVRYYERRGLIPVPKRHNGIRHYDGSEVDRLAIIRYYRSCGVSIKDLRSIFGPGTRSRERARVAIARRIAELNDIVRSARAMQRRLHALLECQCDGDRERCVVYEEAAGRGNALRGMRR